jgi:leukotriene-A4 hydrolase
MDPNSLSNIDEFVTHHLSWNISVVDFQKSTLVASVELTLNCVKDATVVTLDTKDLKIISVENNSGALKHEYGQSHKVFGSPLKIHLNAAAKKGDILKIKVHYETTPSSSAIQWLAPRY